MIAVDTSAIVAVLQQEEEAEDLISIIEADDQPLMSAATFAELHAVMKHKGGDAAQEIADRFIEIAGIQIVSLTPQQAEIACAAYREYPVLNLGDSYAYALAKDKEIPLSYKGNDFSRTDIDTAGTKL